MYRLPAVPDPSEELMDTALMIGTRACINILVICIKCPASLVKYSARRCSSGMIPFSPSRELHSSEKQTTKSNSLVWSNSPVLIIMMKVR
jgi:hypothetical protein